MAKVGYSKKKLNLDVPVDMKMSRLSTPQQISSYVKKVIKATTEEYHETDVLEVKEVIRNQPGVRLGLRGLLINGKSDPGLVLPENTNIAYVPLIGEHVNVIEKEGVVYFTKILNRKGSVNENSIPGVVGDYNSNTQYGKKFKRTKVKPIELKESSIVYEGRFGEAIHFDGSGNNPTIKISTQNKSTTDEPYRKEDINDSNTSSIYLSSKGDGVEGKKIQIKSNDIFISGDDVRLGSSVETEIEPIVLGNKLKELLDEVFTGTITQNNTTIVANTAKLATLAAIQPPTPQTVDEIKSLSEQNVELTEMNIKLQTSITTSTYLSSKVKTA